MPCPEEHGSGSCRANRLCPARTRFPTICCAIPASISVPMKSTANAKSPLPNNWPVGSDHVNKQALLRCWTWAGRVCKQLQTANSYCPSRITQLSKTLALIGHWAWAVTEGVGQVEQPGMQNDTVSDTSQAVDTREQSEDECSRQDPKRHLSSLLDGTGGGLQGGHPPPLQDGCTPESAAQRKQSAVATSKSHVTGVRSETTRHSSGPKYRARSVRAEVA